MKTREFFSISITSAILFLGGICAQAQGSYIEYRFIFSGTAYQTNTAGKMVATHITDQTLLKSRADQGNITNLNTVALVYHIGGDPLGDTVEIVSLNGARLTTEFGFFFGSDGALGRTAVGAFDTIGQRRIDPLYTFDNSKYTFSNPDSVGSAFTYKHLVKAAGGKTNAVVTGTMSWAAIPTGTNTSPVLCVGTFSLGRPVL